MGTKDPDQGAHTQLHCQQIISFVWYDWGAYTTAFSKEYTTTIQNQVWQGIVQPVVDPEITQGDNVHYHTVIRWDS